MKLFFQFIFQYHKAGIVFAVFSLIFAGIFALYDVPAESVLYAFLLCAFIGLVLIFLSFFRFRRRYKILCAIYENIPLMTESLPEPDDITQKKLNEMIVKLSQTAQTELNTLKAIRQDSSDYFTVWVHQIKTPISAMQMILQNDESDMSYELSSELFRIEQYAEMALQYIRLDSSVNDFVIKHYEIDNIIRQAVRKYAPLFIRRKIRLIYEPVSAEVLTDEKWLTFVIEQLLSNAVKYTYSGSVTISYADNILTVSDTGIGISPEDLPLVFEKGYTGLSGRTEKKSTGLGLYLCRNVCSKLGHKIYAVSEVDKGTEFFIDLSEHKLILE